MSETFYCKGEQVHFSNGGCRELYIAWSACAEELLMAELSIEMLKRVELGLGCSADGIDGEYLSDQFWGTSRKKEWLLVMEMLIADIAAIGKISDGMDINWNDDLRKSWLMRLRKIEGVLREQTRV